MTVGCFGLSQCSGQISHRNQESHYLIFPVCTNETLRDCLEEKRKKKGFA